MSEKKIRTALVSVYYKEGLDSIAELLHRLDVKIYSTGGTYSCLNDMGIVAEKVEDLTTYPSILGGRVKTLHPAIFGGILARSNEEEDLEQLEQYRIPVIDLVIVDLYPFEETVRSNNKEDEIIEKIDIGGISLIRAAAKNYRDVMVISGRDQYGELVDILEERKGVTTIEERRLFASRAFQVSSAYDTAIFSYFNRQTGLPAFRESIDKGSSLRYGENPHQKGIYYGDPDSIFTQLHGKEISYNNFLDIDAAFNLIDEFDDKEVTFVIIKHNNACGVASRGKAIDAWKDALACDPVSAYGGVIITNTCIDESTAAEINKIFFEIIIAPDFDDNALAILKQKKNRIILKRKRSDLTGYTYRTVLNGVLWQERDNSTESSSEMKAVTTRSPGRSEMEDLVFANIIVKHSKSNAIVLARNRQLMASGIGQTSRVDALKQAIEKAKFFGFDLKGSVMASDAFFPFSDSVQIAHEAGITAVVQPGGSVRDKDSIEYCSDNDMAMVFTGIRHFRH